MRGLRNEYDVVFVLPHMGGGGAQRVVSLVANAWARQGKCICVLTWEDRRPHTHAELMRKKGFYAEMFRVQLEDEPDDDAAAPAPAAATG